MQKSGFKWLALGRVKFRHVRDGVTKGRFDNFDIEGIVNKVRDMGFYVGANYIFGLPDDDKVYATNVGLSVKINSEWANLFNCGFLQDLNYIRWQLKKWKLPDDNNGRDG